MRRSCFYVFMLLLALSSAAHSPNVNKFGTNNEVLDFVGIFYGNGNLRLNWTENEWEPYVVHTFQNGERKWLFQGFSFLDLSIDKKTLIHSKNAQPATKVEWDKLIKLLFIKGRGLDALDKTISKLKKELGEPPFRHKITVAIPIPIKGQTNWGRINGNSLNFNREGDRIKALKWYVQEFLMELSKHHYNNFDFVGFYWVEEDMEQTEGLAKQISAYLHNLGYKHYWKPYSTAKGSTYWDEYDFDYCYLQPGGYCINKDRNISRVVDALEKAKRRGAGMLYEFDSRIFFNPELYVPRLHECIDMFEKYGVYKNSSMTYYEGALIIYSIYKGKYGNIKNTPKQIASIREVMDRIAEHIVKRYTDLYGIPTTNPYYQSPSNQSPANTNNNDWRNPEYWHF